MGLSTLIASTAAKATRTACRLSGKGGTNKPGEMALKVNPRILGELARGVKVIIVTGTNGKTTTSRMIEKALQKAGKSYFCNKSGANLIAGITAEFIANSSITGKCKYEYALIECDEAAFKAVSRYVNAKYVVVTNIFRDQLDRYGEVTHTLNSIKIGLKNSKNAVVCLNADDSLSASLAEEIPDNKILYYGVDCEIYKSRAEEVSDAKYCIKCKTEYEYTYMTYGHLGGFKCPNCGYQRPATDVSVTEIIESDADSSKVKMDMGDGVYDVDINLPGGYNIYNAAATACFSKAIGFENEKTVDALSQFECGFGRMEKITINNIDIRMILVKNPAGCNQVLNYLGSVKEKFLFVIALNDQDADGTDISWIYDVDFEKLKDIDENIIEIWTTGIRFDDMALRLKFAGFPESKIKKVLKYEVLLQDILDQPNPVYLMPTYTAMLDIRDRMSKNFGIKDFWE